MILIDLLISNVVFIKMNKFKEFVPPKFVIKD